MNVTKAEYAALQARSSCPVREGWKDGALTIWVPGTPKHFKGKGHRFTVSRHTKDWRERTASRVFAYAHQMASPRGRGSESGGGK